MQYVEPPDGDRAALDHALDRGDQSEIVSQLLGVVADDPDWRWLQQTCLDLLAHPDVVVRANAVTALGHIARIHGTLDRDKVIAEVNGLAAREPSLAGRVESALSDIRVFVDHRKT